MFSFRIDELKKLVHVKVAGIQSVEEADKLTEELIANASAARRKFGSFKLLVDARESPVQPAATMARYKPPHELLETDKDRYAIVLGSMLSKLQADRMFGDDRMRAFLALDVAEDWLLGDLPSKVVDRG